MLPLEFHEHVAENAPHGAGALRTSAGDYGNAEVGGIGAGDVFGDEDQGADEAVFAAARTGDGGHGAQAAGEHGVAQEGFAKIVGGVSEGDDVGAQIMGDFIDGAAAV